MKINFNILLSSKNNYLSTINIVNNRLSISGLDDTSNETDLPYALIPAPLIDTNPALSTLQLGYVS